MRSRAGRFAVAASCAVILLASAGASPSRAYIRPGTTIRANLAWNGEQALLGDSVIDSISSTNRTSMISGDGRYVAFMSYAPNLVPGYVLDLGPDIYVRDLEKGSTKIASVPSSGGGQLWPPGPTGLPEPHQMLDGISDDGRFVAFTSNALNLVPGDNNNAKDVFVHDMRKGDTERVSVSSQGDEADGSYMGSISGNGRYVSFTSPDDIFVPNDTNDKEDVFVHDRKTNNIEIVSLGPKGELGHADSSSSGTILSGSSSISATGRYVVFESSAENFFPEDTNGTQDVFLRDRSQNTTQLVSLTIDGTTGLNEFNGGTEHDPGLKAVSSDGRFVTFTSTHTNFVPNDQGRFTTDGFVRDMRSGRTQRISVMSDGTKEEGPAGGAEGPVAAGGHGSITSEGRFIVFSGGGLAPDDEPGPNCANGNSFPIRVYVHDTRTGATEMVSRSSNGAQPRATAPGGLLDAGCARADFPSISSDGQRVGFQSDATNLVEDDTNHMVDVFLRYIGSDLGLGWLNGEPAARSASPSICFPNATCILSQGTLGSHDSTSDVGQALTKQGANLYGASLAYRPQYTDLFVKIQLEHMPVVTGTPLVGNPSILYGFDFTANGDNYQVRVQRIAGPDFEQMGGASFGLFRKSPATGLYAKVATLHGGYGTTGKEVVFSLPLHDIGLEDGGNISDVTAFTALGFYDLGALKVLDQLSVGQ